MRSPISVSALALLQCLLVGVTPCSLHAQAKWPLAAGARVRVTHSDRCCRSPQVGELVSVSGDSVVLSAGSAGGRMALSRAAIWSIERGDGAGSHVVRGAVFGLLIGGGIGVALGHARRACEYSTDDCWAGLSTVLFGGGVALLGATTGAIVGAQMPRERWRRMAIPASLGAGPAAYGGFAVGFTLRR